MQTFPHYCFFAKATALAHEYMRKTWRMRTCANHVSNWTLEHCFMTVWMSGNVGLDSGLGLLSQANYPIGSVACWTEFRLGLHKEKGARVLLDALADKESGIRRSNGRLIISVVSEAGTPTGASVIFGRSTLIELRVLPYVTCLLHQHYHHGKQNPQLLPVILQEKAITKQLVYEPSCMIRVTTALIKICACVAAASRAQQQLCS